MRSEYASVQRSIGRAQETSDFDMRRAMMCITRSVGDGGINDRGNVKTVQILLNMRSAEFCRNFSSEVM